MSASKDEYLKRYLSVGHPGAKKDKKKKKKKKKHKDKHAKKLPDIVIVEDGDLRSAAGFARREERADNEPVVVGEEHLTEQLRMEGRGRRKVTEGTWVTVKTEKQEREGGGSGGEEEEEGEEVQERYDSSDEEGDASPPRRQDSPDASPPRRRVKREESPDASPPRRRKRAEEDEVILDSRGRPLAALNAFLRNGEQDEDAPQYEWGVGEVKKKNKRTDAPIPGVDVSFTIYEGDSRVDAMLREKEHWGDPMAGLLSSKSKGKKKKKKKRKKGAPAVYEGPAPPPNRFNIMPGAAWDGFDRSNGWEAKWIKRRGQAKLRQIEKTRYIEAGL